MPACPPTACLPAPAPAPPLGSLHLSPVTATMEIRTVRSFVHAALQQAGCGPPVQSVPTPSVPSAHLAGCQAITLPGPAGHGDQLGSRRPIQHQQHGGRAARAEAGNRPSASVPLQSPLWLSRLGLARRLRAGRRRGRRQPGTPGTLGGAGERAVQNTGKEASRFRRPLGLVAAQTGQPGGPGGPCHR